MSLVQSKAQDVNGIKIFIDTLVNGVPTGTQTVIGHVTSFGNLVDKSRNETKHTPINDTQYEEIISLGSLTQNGANMTVLYDIEGTEGINLLEDSIDNKTAVQLIIEVPIDGKTTGAISKQIVKCSSFTVSGAADGKFEASFTASKIGFATKTDSVV